MRRAFDHGALCTVPCACGVSCAFALPEDVAGRLAGCGGWVVRTPAATCCSSGLCSAGADEGALCAASIPRAGVVHVAFPLCKNLALRLAQRSRRVVGAVRPAGVDVQPSALHHSRRRRWRDLHNTGQTQVVHHTPILRRTLRHSEGLAAGAAERSLHTEGEVTLRVRLLRAVRRGDGAALHPAPVRSCNGVNHARTVHLDTPRTLFTVAQRGAGLLTGGDGWRRGKLQNTGHAEVVHHTPILRRTLRHSEGLAAGVAGGCFDAKDEVAVWVGNLRALLRGHRTALHPAPVRSEDGIVNTRTCNGAPGTSQAARALRLNPRQAHLGLCVHRRSKG